MRYKSTSHILHLILTIVTGGFWIIIWILCALLNGQHNRKLLQQTMEQASKPDSVRQAEYDKELAQKSKPMIDKIIDKLF